MPQIFQVLRCYKCMVFQVHQTKKSNKWACKLCGEKQSVKRHYGLGTAKDCRLHVQRLNGLRAEMDESKALLDDEISTSMTSTDSEENQDTPKTSKWTNFIEEAEETLELETPKIKLDKTSNTLGGLEVVLEVPKKKKKVIDKTNNKNANHFTVPSYESKHTVKEDEIPPCKIKRVVPSNNYISTHNNFVENRKEVKVEKAPKVESKYKVDKYVVKKDKELQQPSKWDQYVEDEVENMDEVDEPQHISTGSIPVQDNINISRNKTGNLDYKENMFSLCDDQDIDKVLNF